MDIQSHKIAENFINYTIMRYYSIVKVFYKIKFKNHEKKVHTANFSYY
jgi:hypothetical protein